MKPPSSILTQAPGNDPATSVIILSSQFLLQPQKVWNDDTMAAPNRFHLVDIVLALACRLRSSTF